MISSLLEPTANTAILYAMVGVPLDDLGQLFGLFITEFSDLGAIVDQLSGIDPSPSLAPIEPPPDNKIEINFLGPEIAALLRKGDLLASHVDAAGHYRRLERELFDAETESKELERRLELAERIEQARVDVRAQRVEAERALLQELSERRTTTRPSGITGHFFRTLRKTRNSRISVDPKRLAHRD